METTKIRKQHLICISLGSHTLLQRGRPAAFTAVLLLKLYLDPVKVLTGKIKDVAVQSWTPHFQQLQIKPSGYATTVISRKKHRSHYCIVRKDNLFINVGTAIYLYCKPTVKDDSKEKNREFRLKKVYLLNITGYNFPC